MQSVLQDVVFDSEFQNLVELFRSQAANRALGIGQCDVFSGWIRGWRGGQSVVPTKKKQMNDLIGIL